MVYQEDFMEFQNFIKELKKKNAFHHVDTISNSGSNTEFISAFVDIHSKNLVKKLESFVEDTPDLLRILQNENTCGPQPENSFPVTVDVSALYTNIHTDK